MPKLLASGADSQNKTDKNGDKNGEPEKKEDNFFESKLFRMLTVGIYLGAVSGMGFMISFYHLFFWDSRKPQLPPNNREG